VNASTFNDALDRLLQADAARPLVTFYDDATGERIELSVATFANWVSKTAGLAQDELDLDSGDLVLVDLPTHWLGAVWLGAAWTSGLVVTTDPTLADEADVVVCGPDGVAEHARTAGERPVVALSLRPLGGRFTDPLPDGVTDYGAVVLAQPDVYVPVEPPSAGSQAWRESAGSRTQGDLLADASASSLVSPSGRLLTDVNPCSARGLQTLLAPVLQGASTVWVANPDEDGWRRRYDAERATDELRARPAD
jgi:uncharacterized protein (TIGR03089 family)